MKFERCEHSDDISIVEGDQEGGKVLIVFCVKRLSEEGIICTNVCSNDIFHVKDLCSQDYGINKQKGDRQIIF